MTDTDTKIQKLLAKNREFSKTWRNPLKMEEMRPMALSQGGGLIILTCLDPRCVPEQFFGPGFQGAVYRNAGGRATKDAINSILVLRTLMDASAVLVIHHTGMIPFLSIESTRPAFENVTNLRADCGITHITDEDIRQDAMKRTPNARGVNEHVAYGCIPASEFEKTIQEDVEILRSADVLAGVDVRGFAMETETGFVAELKSSGGIAK